MITVAFLTHKAMSVWGAGAKAEFQAASLLHAKQADKAKGSFLAVVMALSIKTL